MEKKESVNLEELDKVSGGLIMLEFDPSPQPITCICSAKFGNSEAYERHLKEVHGEDLFGKS